MASKAEFIQFLASGIHNPVTGAIYSGAIVAFFNVGTSTPAAVWLDADKTLPTPAGITQTTFDTNGRCEVFGDQAYDIKIYAPTDTGLTTPVIEVDDANFFRLVQGDITTRVDSIYELVAVTPLSNSLYEVTGFYEPGDGGGGTFLWDATQPRADADGGIIIDPTVLGGWDGTASTIDATYFSGSGQGTGSGNGCWIRRVESDGIRAKWFGVTFDGTVKQESMNAAILYCKNNGYQDLILSQGTVKCSDPWENLSNHPDGSPNAITVVGAGMQSTVIDCSSLASEQSPFKIVSISGVPVHRRIKDLTILGNGLQTGVELNGICGYDCENVLFTNLRWGLMFHNGGGDINGRWTEFCVARKCWFYYDCKTAIVYRRGDTAGYLGSSFHGPGFKECIMNSYTGVTAYPSIQVGYVSDPSDESTLVYNAPWDGQIFENVARDRTVISVISANPIVITYGTLTWEAGGAISTTLCSSPVRLALHAGELIGTSQGSYHQGDIYRVEYYRLDGDQSITFLLKPFIRVLPNANSGGDSFVVLPNFTDSFDLGGEAMITIGNGIAAGDPGQYAWKGRIRFSTNPSSHIQDNIEVFQLLTDAGGGTFVLENLTHKGNMLADINTPPIGPPVFSYVDSAIVATNASWIGQNLGVIVSVTNIGGRATYSDRHSQNVI